MSLISFWNLSLGRLGDSATVGAPEERSRQAELCRQFYPSARRSVLEMRDWNFNTRIGPLALISDPAADNERRYTYSFPANALRLFRVGDATTLARGADTEGTDFEIIAGADGSRLVLSVWPNASAKYTIDVADPAAWSPLFRDALSWYLASQLAGPMIQGETGRNESRRMLQEFRMLLGEAERSDANQKSAKTERDQHRPDWMNGRGPLASNDAQLSAYRAAPAIFPAV